MKKHQRAFTLLEIMVTLSVASVLLLAAAPSFREFHQSSQLASQVNTMVAALHTAKNEAIKHNLNSYIEPLDSADWSSGWRIFIDNDFDGSFDADKDVEILSQADISDNISIVGNSTAAASSGGGSPYISFNGSGYPRDNASAAQNNLTISIKRKNLNGEAEVRATRNISLSRTGRITSCRPQSANDSTCTTVPDDA